MTSKEHISENFALKGFTSIQIGLYFLLASYLIKIILEGFLIDDNPMGMMSAEILEYLIGSICVFLFVFSSFALFFSAKRRAKKQEIPLWNSSSKSIFWKYLASFLVLFIALIFLMNQGFIDVITPIFFYFLWIHIVVNQSKKQSKHANYWRNLLVIRHYLLFNSKLLVCFYEYFGNCAYYEWNCSKKLVFPPNFSNQIF